MVGRLRCRLVRRVFLAGFLFACGLAMWTDGPAAHAQGFTVPCESSPVQVRPAGKGAASVFLSTRCTTTGDSFFWECQEKKEGEKLLMDCTVQHADGKPGQKVRVVMTTHDRLGGTLCSIVCRQAQ
ncbi:hypothetical protein [Megalodesulfovibrio paquesii]